ncbi:MAG: hypothetical protein GF411_10140 [Candidatus Lokiarchaeota archaeon]|nr:hypothetical protein [Candidatus Lokiarchaeota archaeon]
MSSNWLVKTRQMSEAGKEIFLGEALVTHMRSSRDRQLFRRRIDGEVPLEDLIREFAAFYLHTYQGTIVISYEDTGSVPAEEKEKVAKDEQSLLREEIKLILDRRFNEGLFTLKTISEFVVRFCNECTTAATDETVRTQASELIKEYLTKIPSEFSPNCRIDFLNEITGWANEWREELYIKASGLKESSLSLIDELTRPHDQEIVEISVLKRGINQVIGETVYLRSQITPTSLDPEIWEKIVDTVIKNLCKGSIETIVAKTVHALKREILEFIEDKLKTPYTIEKLETELGTFVAERFSEVIMENQQIAFDILDFFTQTPAGTSQSTLSRNGVRSAESLAEGLLKASTDIGAETEVKPEDQPDAPAFTKEELERLERSIKRIDKLERTLEKPVKGMLKARGLRASELDKIDITLLTKDPTSLLGMEIQVLEALKKKMRVPSPDEVKKLLEARELVKSGALKSMGVSSASDMSQQRIAGETMIALRNDLAWYSFIPTLHPVVRVVETYHRSKQDLLRTKALLKSIYEDADTHLQNLREEILIDLMQERIYEMKTVHPHLQTASISAWFHARLSNRDIDHADNLLRTTPSPLFTGVLEKPLNVDKLEFNNYTIAFDVMQRFLKRERVKKMEKEEAAVQAKIEEELIAERKRASLSPLIWIYTKSHTVFRAIGRVGTKGLEWTATDDAKCANLLAYYVKMHRDRPFCRVCGSTPKEGDCETHGKGHMVNADDIDNLSVFVQRAISDIKDGLIGPTATPMTLEEARRIVRREINGLRRKGKLSSKTNISSMMPGDINYIVGPVIAKLIGKYFNESLVYAARRVDFA